MPCINFSSLDNTMKQALVSLVCRMPCAKPGSYMALHRQRKLRAMTSAVGAHLFPAVSPACRAVPGTRSCSITRLVNKLQASWARLTLVWPLQCGKRGSWAQGLPEGRKKLQKLSYCTQLRRSKGKNVGPKDSSFLIVYCRPGWDNKLIFITGGGHFKL